MSEKKQSFSYVSCGATFLMILYVGAASLNLYRLMYPLAMIDLANEPSDSFVNPLWKPKDTDMYMQVYLSKSSKFNARYLEAVYDPVGLEDGKVHQKPEDVALLWEEKLAAPAFSKSFLLTSLDCSRDQCQADPSYQYATEWLDQAEKIARDQGEGGILETISSAGQGIESTSILLTAYQSVVRQIRKIFGQSSTDMKESNQFLERTSLQLPTHSPLWSALQSNSTIYIHVMVLKKDAKYDIDWPPASLEEAKPTLHRASTSHSLLLGGVNMVKYEPPHHIRKPGRILVNDILYLWKKYTSGINERPPWDISSLKPELYEKFVMAEEMKKSGIGYPYWKPEVSIKYVNDEERYPRDLVGLSGMRVVQVRNKIDHPTGYGTVPALHVDEIGLTSEKYIPLNETVSALPLRISFDRSDMEHESTKTTATAGGMSPARWRLLTHLSEAIEAQKQMGFEQSDIDDIRRLIADTNVTLLAITMLASALHLLFEFLTFKSEVSFWRNNKDLTGLSVRSLFLDMIGQAIILFFLIDKDSSLLMTIPSAIGCLIALWKCQRAAGLRFVRARKIEAGESVSLWNKVLRIFGVELRATRLEMKKGDGTKEHESKAERLRSLTIESDRIATKTLGSILLPFVLGYTVYSLVYEEHLGWYSWLISSASSGVYAFGFVLMTPQLFLNWKLKSVAHLPWTVLMYKSLNTFIDDLFSFIIRMPTMARISCFRDDVVFFIYLYQRWLYPVDKSRPVEGGGEGEEEAKADDKEKKNQ